MHKLAWPILFALPLTVCGQSITVDQRPVVVRVAVPAKLTSTSALRLTGIEASASDGAHLRLFLEKPDANRESDTSGPDFIGGVEIMAGGARAPKSVLIAIPAALLGRLDRNRNPRITIVPMAAGSTRIRSIDWLASTD